MDPETNLQLPVTTLDSGPSLTAIGDSSAQGSRPESRQSGPKGPGSDPIQTSTNGTNLPEAYKSPFDTAEEFLNTKLFQKFDKIQKHLHWAGFPGNYGTFSSLRTNKGRQFKRVNDHYGHAAGDRVLVEVARRLSAAMRGDDLVARWGGEEFLVFAPNIAGAELDQLAERVRLAMNQAPVMLDNGNAIETTVSIGYAAFPLPASHVAVTWEQAVNLADLSLYIAKNQGRNCAVGIIRTTAASSEALREVEADISQARHDGRVTLHVSPTPVDDRTAHPASAASAA